MIADGHHRYATYQELQAEHDTPGPWDGGLAYLVDSTAYPPDLKAIHRVIPALPVSEAVARAKGAWQVHEYADLDEALTALATANGPAYVVTAGGPAHLLTDPDPLQLNLAMPDDRSDRWRSLDTAVLNEFLLPKVWGIEDDEQQVQIVHHDHARATALAQETNGTAVLMRPLDASDVFAVAEEGEQGPQKVDLLRPQARHGPGPAEPSPQADHLEPAAARSHRMRTRHRPSHHVRTDYRANHRGQKLDPAKATSAEFVAGRAPSLPPTP